MKSPPALSARASSRLAIAIGVVCAIVIAWRVAAMWLVDPNEPDIPQGEPTTAVVTIQVDMGDRTPKETFTTAHRDGMTVIDAMRQIHRGSPSFVFESTDNGELVFVESIGGKVGGDAGRYWMFEVNGKHSEIGAGEATLNAGDRVLWQLKAPE